jgi:TPR repeat protein
MLALALVWSCGGVQAAPESPTEDPEPVPAAAEPTDTDEDDESKVAAAAGTNSETKADEAPAWSPETSEGSIERARTQLQRRCDAGSQAACKAIPDLDKCVALKSNACGRLGDLFARGTAGVERNPENARDLWWKACDIVPAECVRYGKILFDMDDLDAREAVADRFFDIGCTSDFQLCTGIGRFYQKKNEPAAAQRFFEKGCAGGQKASCEAKK